MELHQAGFIQTTSHVYVVETLGTVREGVPCVAYRVSLECRDGSTKTTRWTLGGFSHVMVMVNVGA